MFDNASESTANNTLGSVEKAFTILEQLRRSGTIGVSELATALEIPKSTIHIYLQTLRKQDFVVQDDGEYALSYRFLEYGGEHRNRSRLYEVARPEVDKLASETGEVANLGIEENGLRVLLYKSEGPEAIHDNAPIGEYAHMHWTALGKAMLAHYPTSRVESIIDTHGLPRANEHTITDADELVTELEDIRERGYSVEDQDRRHGVLTIAAPIVDRQSDEVISSVSVSGPKNHLDDHDRFDELVAAVKKAANVIELRYSHY
ncbi:IclR family transcriptional regulator [Natrialba aegyptia]|uniref:IclR family transcriptional regulator n=1 Tax=Natrialba aegyptia DSM 13077 TaxID=1227491 RepID=M0AUE7_9EURY|nr:IclR family transcriptional regulator [Natrialba aegyptia]ELZ02185.1 IclR family transcriptional regulator [Natrialba aegyptia DSM 13077]